MKGICFYDLMPRSVDSKTANIDEVQLMRAGKFKHWDDSTLEITPDILRQMKTNFDNNVKKVDLAVDYFHASHAEAAGWIKDVILKENDTQLWIQVDWTETGKQKILDREIRYLSADFDTDYQDNETGERFGFTLNGGGLTNRPFIKGMSSILSDVDIPNEKRQAIEKILRDTPPERNKSMEFSDLKKEVFALSEDQKKELIKLCGGEAQTVQLSSEVEKLKKENADLKSETVKLSAAVANQKKESEFAVLLSEGKAVAAQKEAFMKGDIAEFTKLAQPVNLSEKGNGGVPNSDKDAPKTASEAEDKVLQLADAKRKDNKDLQLHEAIKQVLQENPDLAKLYG